MRVTDDKEILVGVLRAEANGKSLLLDKSMGRVHVCLEDKDGRVRTMGWVSEEMMHHDPEGFWKCVGRIKFADRKSQQQGGGEDVSK